MTTQKLSHGEAKVLQALRAGPMELYVLEERFSGNCQPWLASLKEKQLIQSSEYGWKITPAGRAACPSRRDMEKPEHLPQAAIAVPRKQTKAQTIGINAIKQQHIKQPEAIMQIPSRSDIIRNLIRENPGIQHEELIAKASEHSTDAATIKKTTDLLEYVMRQGGFERTHELMPSGKPARRYYSHAAWQQRLNKAKATVENTIPTLTQVHKVEQLQQKQPPEPATATLEEVMQTLPKLTDDAEKPSALQVQEGGDHYKNMAIQPVQYIIANNLGFIEGNVVKYVSRWKNKNGVQDLKKARHFLDILIEQQSAA